MSSNCPIASFTAALQGDMAHARMTSEDIVASEQAGQDALISSAHQLPKDGNWELLTSWGLKITGDAGDLFYNVELPAGWLKKATSHSMHSILIDQKGRKRASIFCNYDTRANITPIEQRFTSERHYGADGCSRDFICWIISDRARPLTLFKGFKGSPAQYAFLTEDNKVLGAIKDKQFHFSPAREGAEHGSEKFTKTLAAELATPLTADEFYAQYHHVEPRHDVICATEALAAAGMAQKIDEFLAGRDQWEID